MILKTNKESTSALFSKIVLGVCAIVSLIVVSSIAVYVFTQNIDTGEILPGATKIKSIEISTDIKSILNADTKEVIFTIDDANKYLRDSRYAYNADTFQNTNAKYAGDCFLNAALSNNKDRIVFSTGCLPGDFPQAWIGVYERIYPLCSSNSDNFYSLIPSAHACVDNEKPVFGFRFLIGMSGRNFAWSQDDKTITYEADLGLSGMIETRIIDSTTGKVLEKIGDNNRTDGILLYVSDGDLWQADISGKANVRLIDKDSILKAELSPSKNNIAYIINTKIRETVTSYEGKKEERDFNRYDLVLADRKGANSYLVKSGVMRWGWVPSTDLLWYESSELGQFFDWTFLGNQDIWIYDIDNKKSSLMAKDDQMLGTKWSFDGDKMMYVGYKNDKNGNYKNLSLIVIDRKTLQKKDIFDIPYVGGDRGGPPPIPSFYWNEDSKLIYTAFTPMVWAKDSDFYGRFKSGYLTSWKIPVDGSEPARIFPDVPSVVLNDETYPGVVFNEDFSKVVYLRFKEEDMKGLDPNSWFYFHNDISKPLSLVVYDIKSEKEKVLIEDIESIGGINRVWYYSRDKDDKEIFFRNNYLYILTGIKKQNGYEPFLILKKIDVSTAEKRDFKIELKGERIEMDEIGYSENQDIVYFILGGSVYYLHEKDELLEQVIDRIESIVFYF